MDITSLATQPSSSPVSSLAHALADRDQRADTLSATVDTAIDTLASQLAEGHSAGFLAALAFWSKFHRYSFANAVLIRAQCPHASLVAGFRRWNDQGYRVRPGEKAIWIWCPITRKERDPLTGEPVESVVGFRPGPVFDASQLANLDERPLPQVVRTLPDDVEPLYHAAVARITATGIVVEERPMPDGVYGASQGGRILIRAGMDSRNRCFTLLHELAHELVHRGDVARTKLVQQRELEAEAASYVAASVLGLESVGSRDYLLVYKITAEDLRAAMSTIQGIVRQMLAIVVPDDQPRRRAA